MVRKDKTRSRPAAGADQSALAAAIPCDRRGEQYAGVPGGVQLQEGRCHGARERVSRVVTLLLIAQKKGAAALVAPLAIAGLVRKKSNRADGGRRWFRSPSHVLAPKNGRSG